MTTTAGKTPGTPTEETTTTIPTPEREGAFARLTSDEDVIKVQKTVNFLKPAAKVVGETALCVLSPTYTARKVAQEVIVNGTRYLDSRREKKAKQNQS